MVRVVRGFFGWIPVAALLVTGCCGPDKRLEDMRSAALETPYDTVDYFRYAVRLGDWEAVYDTLSPRTKEYVDDKFGRFAFETFAGGLEYGEVDRNAPPEVKDLPIEDLLHRAQIVLIEPGDPERDPANPRAPPKVRTYRVQLYYKPIPPAKTNFPLIKVGEGKGARWTVGLYEWMQELAP